MERLNKHYNLSASLIKRINAASNGKFKVERDAIEYFLEKGLASFENDKNQILILEKINKNTNDIIFIKSLLIQYYANKNFKENRNPKNDEAFQDFKNKYLKDKFND